MIFILWIEATNVFIIELKEVHSIEIDDEHAA
jgi:hypothetical protein